MAILFFLPACLEPSDDGKDKAPRKDASPKKSCLSIVNGERTTRYPAVVLIAAFDGGEVVGTCTATWVGKTTLLTASHCTVTEDVKTVAYIPGDDVDLQSSRAAYSAALRTAVYPKKVMILEKSLAHRQLAAGRIEPDKMQGDLAVLIFSRSLAPAVLPVLDRPAKAGEDATLVGYGVTHVLTDADLANPEALDPRNIKRIGTNKIAADPEEVEPIAGTLSVEGRAATRSGERGDTIAAQGDSGGPLIVDGAVAGVASTVMRVAEMPDALRALYDVEAVNTYADLDHATARAFFDTAEAAGAVIMRSSDKQEASGDAHEGTAASADADGQACS